MSIQARVFCLQPVLEASQTDPAGFAVWLESVVGLARQHYCVGANTYNLLVFPEHITLPLISTSGELLEYEWTAREIFVQLALDEAAYVLACCPRSVPTGVYNVALLIDPHGEVLAEVGKRNLTQEELRRGFIANNSPARVVSLPFGKVGIAICLDAFDQAYRTELEQLGVELLLMPSANPQLWAAPARASGVWQPTEWMAATVGSVTQPQSSIRYLVNPMLVGEGSDGTRYDGQSAILARSEVRTACPYVGVAEEVPAAFACCSNYTQVPQLPQIGWVDIVA